MARRSYSATAVPTTLVVGIGTADTSLVIADATGWPDGSGGPFTFTAKRGISGEEKILAASRSGTTLSGLTRGYEGTTAAAHAAGETVEHTLSKTDLDEANAHVNATAGVHGATGAVVGTTDIQTLTNKTLTLPTVDAVAATGLTGSVQPSRYVGSTVSGAPAAGAHLLGDFVIDQTGLVFICTVAGTPGTWVQGGSAAYAPLSGVAWTRLADSVLAVDSAFAFASIPGTWRHLRLVIAARGNRASTADALGIRFNADTGANYDVQRLKAVGAVASASEAIGQTFAEIPDMPAATAVAGAVAVITVDIPFYAGTTFHKGFTASGGHKTANASGGLEVQQKMGQWRSTAAINRIDIIAITNSILAGSVATLYGTLGP